MSSDKEGAFEMPEDNDHVIKPVIRRASAGFPMILKEANHVIGEIFARNVYLQRSVGLTEDEAFAYALAREAGIDPADLNPEQVQRVGRMTGFFTGAMKVQVDDKAREVMWKMRSKGESEYDIAMMCEARGTDVYRAPDEASLEVEAESSKRINQIKGIERAIVAQFQAIFELGETVATLGDIRLRCDSYGEFENSTKSERALEQWFRRKVERMCVKAGHGKYRLKKKYEIMVAREFADDLAALRDKAIQEEADRVVENTPA